jgi:O-antigen/teichoic acid export membrane protein
MGLAPALIHRQKGFEEARDTAFTMGVLRGLILAAVLFFISPFIAGFYDEQGLTWFLRVIALALIMDGLRNINLVALQKKLDFKRIAIVEQSVAVISTLGVIILAWYLRSVWALVLGNIVTAGAHMIFSYVIVPGRIRFAFDRKIAADLFRYGKFITGMSIVLFIVNEMDTALVGKILGMEVLGYYVVAFLLANLPVSYISRAASRLMFPAYAELQNRPEPLREAYLITIRLVSAITVPAAFGLMVLAPEIIGLIYGEKWLPAVRPLQILAFYGACRSITSLNGYLLNGIGTPGVNFYIALLRLGILPLLLVNFTIRWETTGAAVAVLIAIAFQMLIGLVVVCRRIGIKSFQLLNALFIWTAASGIMAAALFLIKTSFEITLLGLIGLIFSGVAVYLLCAGRHLWSLVSNLRALM